MTETAGEGPGACPPNCRGNSSLQLASECNSELGLINLLRSQDSLSRCWLVGDGTASQLKQETWKGFWPRLWLNLLLTLLCEPDLWLGFVQKEPTQNHSSFFLQHVLFNSCWWTVDSHHTSYSFVWSSTFSSSREFNSMLKDFVPCWVIECKFCSETHFHK